MGRALEVNETQVWMSLFRRLWPVIPLSWAVSHRTWYQDSPDLVKAVLLCSFWIYSMEKCA
uniref:Uncharacterized protein n=1 Tax=Pan troglodytes TaxID=9598 RepID=G2HHR7_PANTR|nr:hypothetical protein [Pan troglodytes]